jgi:hypothetical protein
MRHWLARSTLVLAGALSCGTDWHPAARARPGIAPPLPPLNFGLRVRLRPAPAPIGVVAPRIVTPASPNQALRFRGMPLDELLQAMATRPVVRRVRRYSSTSVVYRLELEGGLEIAFKPAVPGQEGWWRHEVAAFHLARVLGLTDRVPPAVTRRVPMRLLGAEGYADKLVTASDDPESVPGAAIAWLPVLEVTHLDLPDRRAQWEPWLDPMQPLPTDGYSLALADDLASVLLFDYLEANEDRWNEANIAADEFGRIVMRDNNVGWFVDMMRDLTWCEGPLHRARRFPRGLVRAIERADPAAIRAEFARDRGTEGRVADRGVLEAFEARRQHLLAYVRELRERYGDAAVMALP